jgi:hypothetical protein
MVAQGVGIAGILGFPVTIQIIVWIVTGKAWRERIKLRDEETRRIQQQCEEWDEREQQARIIARELGVSAKSVLLSEGEWIRQPPEPPRPPLRNGARELDLD